jgi:hypothetical protein
LKATPSCTTTLTQFPSTCKVCHSITEHCISSSSSR